MKHKVTKAIIYRLLATAFGQGLSWIICRRWEVNAVVLLVDAAQTILYYGYDVFWERVMK